MDQINGMMIFFLILMFLVIYILFEGYHELEEMEERIKVLESQTTVRDDFMRNIILKDINEEEKE